MQLQQSDRLIIKDPRDKEIDELKGQLHSLKSRSPKLELNFSDGGNRIRLEFKKLNFDRDEIIREHMLSIVQKNSLMPKTTGNPLVMIMGPSDEQVNAYNKRLREYFVRYEDWYSKKFDFELLGASRFEIPIILVNAGNLKATDIDVHLKFPKTVNIILEDPSFNEKEPKLPERPTSSMLFVTGAPIETGSPHSAHDGINLISTNNGPEKAINWRETAHNFEVDIHIHELKHNYQLELQAIFIQFSAIDAIHNLTVEYSISSETTIDSVSGQLHLIATEDEE